jgi:hypothetical protein
MTTLTPPVSDLDLGIDIGVRCGLDQLVAETSRQELLAREHDLADDPGAAARHHYATVILRTLAEELAERFRQVPS